ncbi:MAG: TIGR04283 family arsenosugar biosynthesis glycosyltransferase [Saprospiraceae bacterium]
MARIIALLLLQLSIIIPTLNEAANIGRLLPYLREHGGAAVAEILVVDGNSTDGTAQIATEAGARVLTCEVCSRAAQMNLGAREAQCEVLYFVHADTLPPPSFAQDIQREMAAGQAMGCYRYQFDSPRWILKFNAYFVRYPWLWCQGGDKTFFIRREIFEALGGYDEHFVVMEEYDFLRRAMPQYRLRILPKNVLVSARKYAHNSWLRVQIANIGAFSMFRWGAAPSRIKRFYKWMLRA